MRIAFCDDHKNLITELDRLVKQYNKQNYLEDEFFYFTTPSKLYSFLQTEKIDVIFMDLEFNNISEDGIEWSKRITMQFPKTIIIILTAYENRYKEGYVARAFRFMTKPIQEKELYDNLYACRQELLLNQTISFVRRGVPYDVLIHDIFYISAQSGGSELWTSSNIFYGDESLAFWEEKLPFNIFFRCHKKYLVNLSHVIEFDKQFCTLVNGEKIPISRRKWKEFQIAYMKCDIYGPNHT